MQNIILAGAIIGTIALSGCTGMTESQRGTATGAGIGAVAGAAIGALAGGGKGAAIGAGVGAAAGAGGGYLWSQHIGAEAGDGSGDGRYGCGGDADAQ